MGQDNSTTNVGISGLRIFNAYQKNKSKPCLEDMTWEYAEEDNIKVLLTEYSNWLATTATPNYFDEDLKHNSTLFLDAIILKNYLSKVIIILKYKFTKHCTWEEP